MLEILALANKNGPPGSGENGRRAKSLGREARDTSPRQPTKSV